MKPKVFSVSSVEQIEPHLQSARQNGLPPTLAVAFSSVVHDLTELSSVFAKYDIEVFGASASGEITNDEVHEESIAVMLLDISRDAFRLNVFDGEGKASYQVGQNVAEWAKTIYDNPALMVMSAGLRADGEQIVKGIIDAVEPQIPLFGGFAAFDPAMMSEISNTFVFNSSRVFSNGVVALVFDQNVIEVEGIAASGWKEIGTPKTITKAAENIVYNIDDEPALVPSYLNKRTYL
jgi:adenylate cyclase